MIKLLMVFILVGCATSGKKKVDLEEVTNEDFKKPAPARYSEDKDYYQGVEIKNAGALEGESLYRLRDYDGDIDAKDPLAKIAKLCYDGEFKEGLNLVSREQERYRNNPSFWNQTGTCYLLQGERRKALLFYNKALEFKANYGPALNNIGVMYRKEGEDQKAEVAFSRAIDSSNFAKTPRFNLAQLYLDYGLFNDAIRNLKPLENDKDVDVLAGLGTAYLMAGNSQLAANYFQKIDEDFFERPYIGINAALAFHAAGKKEKASDALDEVDKDKLGPFKSYYDQAAKRIGL